MSKSKQYYIRKAHRWLGVLLGIQFIFWTVGGIYFSWSNMDEIHGDFQKSAAPLISSDTPLVSPSLVMQEIKKHHRVDSIVTIQLIEILGRPTYQIRCVSNLQHTENNKHDVASMNHLADAVTGQLRGPLTQDEAIAIAQKRFNGDSKVRAVAYLTNTNGHHEYRENPLPAYAISFEHPTKTTVYVASQLGTIQKFRNDKWRIFDFLWMLHTMDYSSRDNFGNILLKCFSVFGLFTVMSGFVLFALTMPKRKKVG
ncbi:MAG TPA: hypothetical protein DIW54_07785 [Chitinophagaceae bacterium]|jgi:uncharacterized iron-regulated membrane protein|nr:hypothetical protein [Chitinophagaceae bacterium]HCT23226.1 hypothetical protein [Chitinophagaceae bacterium]